jgi:hypothetical protein
MTIFESGFSTRGFVASSKPWDYMIATGWEEAELQIPDTELSLLYDELESLDEYHISFAMTIAERFAPSKFAIAAAQLLGHPSMSVRVNAYRVVQAVPQCDITDDLREAVEVGMERCPERQQFADALLRTE